MLCRDRKINYSLRFMGESFFRKISVGQPYNGTKPKPREVYEEDIIMHTQAYIEARKEFINCIVLSPICIFVSLIIAFTEWLPIMHAEKNKVEA